MIGAAAAAEENAADLVAVLADRYYGAIFNYLHHMVHDRELAQELAQDVFLRAFDGRRELPGVANQRAWLYRVATNLALTAIKRRARFAWLPWDIFDSLRAHQADASEEVGRQTVVEQALAALPPKYRAPLLMRDLYGFSLAEIALALDLTENAVGVQLHRARQMFRAAYEQENAR